jgi:hypothetical protein
MLTTLQGKEVVKEVMCLLWASRRGLYLDTELSVLLQQRGIESHHWDQLSVGTDDSDASLRDARANDMSGSGGGAAVLRRRSAELCEPGHPPRSREPLF